MSSATLERRERRVPARNEKRPFIHLLDGINFHQIPRTKWSSWWAEVDAEIERQGFMEGETRMMLDSYGLQPLEDFRAWVKAFRQMTDIYQAYTDGDANSASSIGMVGTVLEELLETFGPRVEYGPDPEEGEFTPDPRVLLEEALALQLYNHIAAGDSYNVCANEPCRRWFDRQSGRAHHGQYHKHGVLYCSTNCAGAQMSREYRRRQRNKRGP